MEDFPEEGEQIHAMKKTGMNRKNPMQIIHPGREGDSSRAAEWEIWERNL